MKAKLNLCALSLMGLSLAACTADQMSLATQVLNTAGALPTATIPQGRTTATTGQARASMNGKYSGLKQTVYCQEDITSYGDFYESRFYYDSTEYCGQKVQKGYWIYVKPYWYVWQNKNFGE